LLQPERDSAQVIAELKREVGSRVFAAQYRQNATPPEGNMIKAAWLRRYDAAPDRKYFQRVVLSCDPAGKAGIHNDFTAITVVGFHQRAFFVLDVRRGHWTVLQMRQRIIELATQWQVDLVIVEDTSSGMGLTQLLKEQPPPMIGGTEETSASFEARSAPRSYPTGRRRQATASAHPAGVRQ